MKKAGIDINNLPPLNKRLYQFAIENAGSIYAFSKNIELSQPRINSLFHVSEKTGKYPTIQSDVIEAILKKYTLNTPWFYTGFGSMLKNIPENSENLSKQSTSEERNNSIDELINQKIEKTVMENLDRTIDTILKNMKEILKDQNQSNTNNLKILIEAVMSIVKEEDKEEIKNKLVALKKNVG